MTVQRSYNFRESADIAELIGRLRGRPVYVMTGVFNWPAGGVPSDIMAGVLAGVKYQLDQEQFEQEQTRVMEGVGGTGEHDETVMADAEDIYKTTSALQPEPDLPGCLNQIMSLFRRISNVAQPAEMKPPVILVIMPSDKRGRRVVMGHERNIAEEVRMSNILHPLTLQFGSKTEALGVFYDNNHFKREISTLKANGIDVRRLLVFNRALPGLRPVEEASLFPVVDSMMLPTSHHKRDAQIVLYQQENTWTPEPDSRNINPFNPYEDRTVLTVNDPNRERTYNIWGENYLSFKTGLPLFPVAPGIDLHDDLDLPTPDPHR